MKEKQSPIQQKLMRLVLVSIGVVLVLTCVGFFSYEFFTYRQASKERLSTLAEIIASNSTAALAFQNQDDANEILSALKAEKHIVAAALYDKRGNLFAWYPLTIPKYNLPIHPAADRFEYANSSLQGFVPVIEDENRQGTLYLQSDMQAIYQRFERYGLIALLVITLSVMVAYLLSEKLQKTISEPILTLAKTARNISEKKDYTVRAKKLDEDELGVLTDAFNQMLTQIEKQNAEILLFNHELEMKVIERTNELEQANTELRLKSELVETIIDSSVDIIAVFDKEYKYVILNQSARNIFGLEGQNVIGKNLIELFPQLKSSVMYQQLQQTFEKGEMVLDQYYNSQVTDRVLQNFFIPLSDKDGQVDRVLVIGHDITEINRAHEKLKVLNQQLEKSNQDLEQFAFVASHDLQEPLRKIQTFSQLLEYKLDDKEAAKKYLEKVINAASRMTELIIAVLNYSRLSSEKGTFETVDLNEVVENVRNDLELKIADKGAVIQTEQLPVVRGNRLQLTQLFLNLIGNSIKFSKRTPLITISAALVDSSSIQGVNGSKGSFLELVFKDNGIGFEQQYADKIFTVFQRLHGKQEYPGTGIGLALCKKIINNHDGEVAVTSIPGEGATFRIYFPANSLVAEDSTALT